jgi:hypothetical protein
MCASSAAIKLSFVGCLFHPGQGPTNSYSMSRPRHTLGTAQEWFDSRQGRLPSYSGATSSSFRGRGAARPG